MHSQGCWAEEEMFLCILLILVMLFVAMRVRFRHTSGFIE